MRMEVRRLLWTAHASPVLQFAREASCQALYLFGDPIMEVDNSSVSLNWTRDRAPPYIYLIFIRQADVSFHQAGPMCLAFLKRHRNPYGRGDLGSPFAAHNFVVDRLVVFRADTFVIRAFALTSS